MLCQNSFVKWEVCETLHLEHSNCDPIVIEHHVGELLPRNKGDGSISMLQVVYRMLFL